MQVGLGFWASKTLLSAVEMEVLRNWREAARTLKRSGGGWDCIRAPHATFLMLSLPSDFCDGKTANTPTPRRQIFSSIKESPPISEVFWKCRTIDFLASGKI